MKLFGLKSCDTCRKAMKSLQKAEFVDIRTDGVPASVLQRAFEAFDENLVNKRSTTWRNLTEEERDIAPMELLKRHPTLMKRPLIEAGDQLYLGWSKDTEAALSR